MREKRGKQCIGNVGQVSSMMAYVDVGGSGPKNSSEFRTLMRAIMELTTPLTSFVIRNRGEDHVIAPLRTH